MRLQFQVTGRRRIRLMVKHFKQRIGWSKKQDFMSTRFSLLNLLFFGVVFAALGGYVIMRSFAATPPSGLILTALDSTIRANWTPPAADASVKWQVASVWTGDGNKANGSKLVSSKVVGATANVADMNGLRSGDTFTVKIQSMDASGALSSPVSATAATDPQSPLTNAAFFDNFNDAMMGSLNSNYYDVRSWSGYGDTQDISDAKKAFVSERHFHTQVIEDEGQGGVMIRPRLPVNLTNSNGSSRTTTMEFEIDIPPVQSAHGKWFEVHLSKDIPNSHDAFGSTDVNNAMPNNIRFAIDRQTDKSDAYNVPNIQVNINGVNKRFVGNSSLFAPANVRVPVVIKVSQNYAAMIVNGKTEVETTPAYYLGANAATNAPYTLPFNVGHWSLMDVNYRSAYDGSVDATMPQGPTITNELGHWDMIQWDGETGSYNPVIKTYLQSGCDGYVYMRYQDTPGCPTFMYGNTHDATVNLNIPASDDLSKVRSARLLFNAPLPQGMTVTMNGNSLTSFPAVANAPDTIQPLNVYELTPTQLTQLRSGNNAFAFHTSGLIGYVGASQLELEVVYNQQRVLTNPPQDFMPMFGVTSSNFRYDKLTGQPDSIMTGTTYLYAMGGEVPHNYTIQQIYPAANPWFTITTPLSGALTSIAAGGQMVPISWQIDFSKFTQPSVDQDVGRPAIIKISGGAMDVFIGIVAAKDQNTAPQNLITFTNNSSTFNKAGIPDYHATTSPPPTSSKTGDLNSDNAVNIFDLSILLSNYGKTKAASSNPACDINNDNNVNIFDLSILLSNYGT
jgi:hypothetical protein